MVLQYGITHAKSLEVDKGFEGNPFLKLAFIYSLQRWTNCCGSSTNPLASPATGIPSRPIRSHV